MTTVIPFGPQHPVLPEPVSLKLELDNDVVIGALPSLGYVHRGLEKFIDTKDYNQTTYICERICGICSALHGITYTRAVEKLFDVEIPESCLLYTSDAADEEDSVDLGGRRIIKKKK